LNNNIVEIFTDGSCNPQYQIGGWAALLIIDNEEIILQGEEVGTTHNRMELLAAIKSFEFIESLKIPNCKIKIYSDSQYLVRIVERKDKLQNADFKTKKNGMIQNIDLLKKIINFIGIFDIEFIKVIAHAKKDGNENHNRKVDMLSRKIVRNYVKNILEERKNEW
jgi:ribonuclease HI